MKDERFSLNNLFSYLAVFLVFATMFAFSWLHGGARADALLPTIPWLWVFLCEVLLCFPQRHPHEDPLSARRRVWMSLKRDPMFYLVVFFLVILAIPMANRGLCPDCDAAKIMAGVNPDPPLPFAPFCVSAPEHLGVILWFVPILTAMLAVKHGLGRSGKRVLMEMLVWNGAALAILGFVQRATGATSAFWGHTPAAADFFSVFGYPNMGGAFFTMLFAFSVGVWQMRVSEVAQMPHIDHNKGSVSTERLNRALRAHYPLVAVVLNFFAALSTLCRAAIILVFVLAALAFLYYECSLLLARHHRARRVKSAALVFFGAILFVISIFVFAPPQLAKEIDSLNSYNVADRVAGKGQYHVRVATAIFKDHPFFGVGGWGYRHYFKNYLRPDEKNHIQIEGGANVHNDYLQFLCEHGVVGVGCLFAILVMLLSPVFTDWYRLLMASRFLKNDKAPPMPRAIYCLPAGTFWILLGNIALLIHAFGDCPMRSAACLSMFFVTLACAPGYIPRDLEETSNE